jgi:uncharacterized protein (TIGR03545 family)
MTNSIIDPETPPPVKINNQNPKAKKKKGAIRFEALMPILLIIVLSAIYGRYLFDSNLRSTIEWTATKIYGAEINIAKIKTSVFDASFLMEGLEVTDKDKPRQNLVKIGNIKFQFLWDALLRAKFVIEDAGIFDIQVFNPREKPGQILPVSATSNEAIKKLEEGILNQGKKEFDGNALGDIAAILGGADPASQIDTIKETLMAEKRIDEISKSIDLKEKEWSSKIASIGNRDKFSDLQKEIKAINIKKNPIKALKKYNESIQKVKSIVNEYKNASKAVQTDIKDFTSSFKEIDSLAKQDIAALKGRFKIPDINVTDFSKNLFGNMFRSKVAMFKKYSMMAEEYMPPSKAEKAKMAKENGEGVEVALVPHVRGKGRDYKFPITSGYPLFWLKKAGISSKDDGSAYSGDLAGEITNFSTDPGIVKEPTKIHFTGDFKSQEILGIDIRAKINSLSAVTVTTVNGKIDRYKILGLKFSESDSLKFGINKARGNTKINAIVSGDKMDVRLQNNFSKIDYNVLADDKNVKQILTKVANGIRIITLRAQAKGLSGDLNWNINSNLGQELSKGIKGQVQEKINQAEQKIKNLIDEKIGDKKNALQAKFSKLRGRLDKILADKQKTMSNSQNKILSDIKNKQKANSPKKKVERKARNLIKNLGKKLKLPF